MALAVSSPYPASDPAVFLRHGSWHHPHVARISVVGLIALLIAAALESRGTAPGKASPLLGVAACEGGAAHCSLGWVVDGKHQT